MKTISLVLPVFNEAEGIINFHAALLSVLIQLESTYHFEIVYVVDKSGDSTLQILSEVASESKNVTVLGLSRRFGHQMSLIAGLDHASGDAVIMMDTDLEHPPEIIPQLLEQFEYGFDIVRTKRIYAESIPLMKRITSSAYYRLLNFLSDEKLNENDADFRLLSRKVVDQFKKNIREHNQYLRGLVNWVGFKQTQIQFVSRKRQYGQSKYNLRRLFTFGLQGIISFSKVPLQISILLGFITAILGVIYGLVTIFQRIFRPEFAPSGWVSIIVILLIVGGIQLVVLGVIGEYIGAIFDEVKNRPLYIIEEIYGKGNNLKK